MTQRPVTMKVRKVTGECYDGDCPAVHVSDRGTLVFRGDAVTAAEGLLNFRPDGTLIDREQIENVN